jgi:hypothetical protein
MRISSSGRMCLVLLSVHSNWLDIRWCAEDDDATFYRERPATVEHLTLGGPYPGLSVAEPLPEGFDWRSADSVRISVYMGTAGWGATAELAEVKDRSADLPPDTYWFQSVGRLDPAGVAAQDGTTFLATLHPRFRPRLLELSCSKSTDSEA